MKLTALFLTLLLAGVIAAPEPVLQSAVDTADHGAKNSAILEIILAIVEVIRELVRRIDPVSIENYEVQTTVLDGILNLGVAAQDLNLVGLSTLRVDVRETQGNGIRIDAVWDDLTVALVQGIVWANGANVQLGGRCTAFGLGFFAEVDASLDNGLELNDLDLKFRLRAVECDLRLTVLGSDYSQFANNFLNNTLYQFFVNNINSIERFIVDLVWVIYNRLFG